MQEGNQESLRLERHTEEEARAMYLAEIFGWRCLGWIFAQSRKEREYILSAEEVGQMAAVQDEFGADAVTGVVSMSTDGDVHFEAFQVGHKKACPLPEQHHLGQSLRWHSEEGRSRQFMNVSHAKALVSPASATVR